MLEHIYIDAFELHANVYIRVHPHALRSMNREGVPISFAGAGMFQNGFLQKELFLNFLQT